MVYIGHCRLRIGCTVSSDDCTLAIGGCELNVRVRRSTTDLMDRARIVEHSAHKLWCIICLWVIRRPFVLPLHAIKYTTKL